jgi:hypothetical protein
MKAVTVRRYPGLPREKEKRKKKKKERKKKNPNFSFSVFPSLHSPETRDKKQFNKVFA